jgi:signal transduction histidine kinase
MNTHWFGTLRFSLKLTLAFSLIIVVMIVSNIVAINRVAHTAAQTQDVTYNWLPSVLYLSNMEHDLANIRIKEYCHVLTTDSAAMRQEEQTIDVLLRDFRRNQRLYIPIITSEAEQHLYDECIALFDQYMSEHTALLLVSRQNNSQAADAILRGRSKHLYDQTQQKITELITLNNLGAMNAAEHSTQASMLLRGQLAAFTAVALLLALGLAFSLNRAMSLPMQRLYNDVLDSVRPLLVRHQEEMRFDHDQTRDEISTIEQSLKFLTHRVRQLVSKAETERQYMQESVKTMLTAMEEFARGSHDVHLTSSRNDDIAKLYEGFNATVQKRAILKAELQRKNEHLEQLNEEKTTFLGMVSHDLKNPLSVIVSYAGIVQQESATIDRKELAEIANTIAQVSERMSEIINNLLDLNALERGMATTQPEALSLQSLLQEVASTYHAKAQAKRIAVCLDADAHVSNAWANRFATGQVLDNLLSNAIKYSPFGKQVVVRLLQPNREVVRVEVQDQGQGLSEEDKMRLFGAFAKLSARPTGGEHSTGLGLSIVKKLVESMHGCVWCESQLGRGATFIVELPALLVAPEPRALA